MQHSNAKQGGEGAQAAGWHPIKVAKLHQYSFFLAPSTPTAAAAAASGLLLPAPPLPAHAGGSTRRRRLAAEPTTSYGRPRPSINCSVEKEGSEEHQIEQKHMEQRRHTIASWLLHQTCMQCTWNRPQPPLQLPEAAPEALTCTCRSMQSRPRGSSSTG